MSTVASNFAPTPAASSSSSYQSAKACAVLVDDDPSSASSSAAAASSAPSSSLPKNPALAGSEPRSLPPDGTSFKQIELGPKKLTQVIPAYGYWNVQFYQPEAGYVNFDLEVPRGASIGLYARRNALPTHTNYDIVEVVKGLPDEHRGKRELKVRKK